MPDSPKVQEILDQLLASEATPEEVCRSCPELLSQIRARWEQIGRARLEIEAMFPPVMDTPLRENGVLPRIAGYEVEAVLGQGGVGVVFRARDLRLGRPVAIKMLLAGAYAGPTELVRFRLEAEAVAGLCHANVVQIYDVGEHEGRPYFTMEFVEGGSLAQKLARTPPVNAVGSQAARAQPVRWAAALVASLAEAVSVAHRAGIIHRDLKPGNILLTADGTPKISDFGLARRLKGEGALTWTGTAVGTPSYMAPEQASDTAGPVGPATDVYGLGAVLYELLTGRPPFRAGTALETFRQVLSEEPVPPSRLNPRVPRDLENVCLKCLHKDPQRRYTSAAALTEDLRRYLLGQVVAARPVSQFERAFKWIRRNKWVASLSAVALLALVVGTAASLLFAVEAGRQEGLAKGLAAEREQKILELEAEQRKVEAKNRAIEAEKRESDRIAVAGFLTTIGRNSQPMHGNIFDIAEADTMRQLRATRETLRLLFLDTALSDPKNARRVGRRADYVIQALIGSDRALRAEVGERIVRRIQEPAVPYEVALACARLGLALNLNDQAWAERSAVALRTALRERPASILRDDSVTLAKALAEACQHLPKAQAAEHAALAIDDAVTRLREPGGTTLYYSTLAPAIETLSPHLDAVAAKRTAEAIESLVQQSHPISWDVFSTTLSAISRRLPPSDAAAHVNRMVDFVFLSISTTKEEDKGTYHPIHTKMLATLSGQLDPADAGRVADKIVAILGSTAKSRIGRDEFVTHYSIPNDLASVAERLDASGSLRTAEALINVLKKAEQLHLNVELLRTPLFSLCRRLDVAGAARVADAIAAAVQDPKTPMLPRTLLASAWEEVGGRLDPEKAAALEGAMIASLIADMADAKSRNRRGEMARALGSVGGRPGTKIAALAAKALTVAICDRQTPIVSLKPLAAALVVVCDQLGPVEAYSHACEAVGALDSLWDARTKMYDRGAVADAMASLWKRLSPFETIGRVRRVAACLTDALGDAKTESSYLPYLADVVTAVTGHLQPAEKIGHTRRAVEILVAKFHSKPEVEISVFIPMALARLCVHLERDEIARLADTIFTVLSEGEHQLTRPEVHADMFKSIVAQMDERDLERLLNNPLTASRLQRSVLDVLGQSKHRYFRNTWDYLDWTHSNGNGNRRVETLRSGR